MTERKAILIIKDKENKISKKDITAEELQQYVNDINIINTYKRMCFLSISYKFMETQFEQFSKNVGNDICKIYSLIFNTINSFYTNLELWKEFLGKYKNNKNIFPNGPGEKSIFEIKDSEFYDKNYHYLVVKTLRTYAQHSNIPFSDIELHDNSNKVLMSIKQLLNGKINKKAKTILEEHKKEIFIDVVSTIISAFKVLDDLNNYIFESVFNVLGVNLLVACNYLEKDISIDSKYACITWDNPELPDDDYYKVEYLDIPIDKIKLIKDYNQTIFRRRERIKNETKV